MTDHTLFTDFLSELGVPFTSDYSQQRFADMPFQTMFGFQKLLQEYGVMSEGIDASADKDVLSSLPTPFIAESPEGYLIVTDITPTRVSYLTQGEPESMPTSDFSQAWTGRALFATPTDKAVEPDYKSHRIMLFFNKAKRVVLTLGLALLFLYLFIINGLYNHISTWLLTGANCVGLWLTWQLLRKTLKIKSDAADRVCRVLQAGGCDHVLEQKASTFFGIFSWSEVGFAYFSVSLLCLLIFPEYLPYLAAINLCCLPFTFWSIWYQRFRLHAWCTLCVCVQATLWLLFFCYLGGGWFAGVFPLRLPFFVLGVAYVVVLLAANRLVEWIKRLTVNRQED